MQAQRSSKKKIHCKSIEIDSRLFKINNLSEEDNVIECYENLIECTKNDKSQRLEASEIIACPILAYITEQLIVSLVKKNNNHSDY